MSSFTYDPPYLFSRMVVVGVGGTGSHLARCLARLLYHRQQKRQHVPEVVFVDPDVIEAHNAALNILKRTGWDTPVNGNVAPLPAPSGKGKRKRRSEAARL